MMFLVLYFLNNLLLVLCSEEIPKGVSCSEKKIIVDFHNDLRTKVANGTLQGQPKASNMEKIVWDDALEEIAQNWADKMEFKHNPTRNDSRFPLGENIFMSCSSLNEENFNWEKSILGWFDENKHYKYQLLVPDPATGHYTQVVWGNTQYVGCRAIAFEGKKSFKCKLYVCNYGPAGNFIGEFPYTTGPGCENLCCKSKEQCKKLYGNKCLLL